MIRRHRTLLLALLAMSGVIPVQKRIDVSLGGFRAQQEVLYVWSGEHIRKLSPGFENLMADIYWLRTVQYFGGVRAFSREKRFELLEPLANITISLDPRFEMAYRYGAVFLCEPWPIGAGNPRAGVALLERGVRTMPGSWRLRQDLGFFLFFFLGDAQRASEVLLDAARIPGAPFFLETLAADLLGRSGERATARRIWTRLSEEWAEGSLKWNAQHQLRYLDALDALDRVRAAAAGFQVRNGRPPSSLGELRALGARLQWVDPDGFPWAYNPATGAVAISPESTLWRANVGTPGE